MTASHPTSFRLSVEARRMLDELEAHLGLKRSAVMEMLIRERHRAEGLGTAPKKSPRKSRDRD
jgi:predicted DNA-binding protein